MAGNDPGHMRATAICRQASLPMDGLLRKRERCLLTICQPYAALIVTGEKLVVAGNGDHYRGRADPRRQAPPVADDETSRTLGQRGVPAGVGAWLGKPRLPTC